MKSTTKNIVQIVLFALVIFGFAFWCWFKPASEYSDSERRALDKFPELSFSTLSSGKFMTAFEEYTLDQFPVRDMFRTIKAYSNNYVFGKLDNNDVYVTDDGYIGKLEYPLNSDSISLALNKFRYVYEKYLKDNGNDVFLSVIPDKNAFIAKENGRLVMDYEKFYSLVKENCDYAEFIEIADLLSIDDYYATDTHWRQECITDVAERLAEKMGVTLVDEYKENTLDKEFKGVYYGQAAMPVEPDTLKYLTSDIFDNCIVTNHETGEKMSIYDMEKAYGKDPYEIFLSGSVSLITIENPNASTDKELVIFRDSFGSSLTPLLVSGYKSITVVDIRYIASVTLGNFIDFSNKDVLFIYSTLVLNNSSMLK